ncbi:MAG: hypothetical protein A2Y21_10230 [Clostridiales bacterium GWC2_40_7]|nr:MAG: hypothetical protein A2Y21_10230 [Clostridiales bacterium GWC2_40_7]
MRRLIDIKEDIEETNYWIPVSNLMAAFMLVLLVVLVAGFAYVNNMPKYVPQQQEQQQTENVDQEYLAELEAREAGVNAQSEALKELTGIREGIVAKLSDTLASLDISADIDKKTGSVRFGEAVLFNVNSTDLNPAGQEYLKKLIPAYLSVVLSENNREYIEQIVIEGHADDGGTYLYNLDLSQKRSYSVAGFIISSKLSMLQDGTDAEKLLAISGKSFSRPVMVNGAVDRSLSRRVELSFVLKYDMLMDRMQDAIKAGEE